jgi:AcrR family transcriptional regulator
MNTLSRKQQEIRQRERQILDVARPMLREAGLVGLSMDRLADQMQYAKGTIYNHFPNKEEIVLALAVVAVEQRLSLFHFAAQWQGATRDRLSAVGIACEFYVSQYPELFLAEQIIRHDAVKQKTSQQRRELLTDCESRCMGAVGGIVREAIDRGDLRLPSEINVAEFCFGLWSLVYGGHVLQATSPSLSAIGIRSPASAIHRNCAAVLDGYRWLPSYDSDAFEKLHHQVWKAMKQQPSSPSTTVMGAGPTSSLQGSSS